MNNTGYNYATYDPQNAPNSENFNDLEAKFNDLKKL